MELQNTTSSITLANAEQWAKQLDALQPGKQQQKIVLFQTLYLAIERALAREVPQKAVLAHLSTIGLPLSMGGFRSLLAAERKQRAKTGEYLRCECCGSVLPVSSDDPNPRDIPTLASLASKGPAHHGQAVERDKDQ